MTNTDKLSMNKCLHVLKHKQKWKKINPTITFHLSYQTMSQYKQKKQWLVLEH